MRTLIAFVAGMWLGPIASLGAELTPLESRWVPGSHHDTLAWLRRANDGSRLSQASIFEAATLLWARELYRAEGDEAARR